MFIKPVLTGQKCGTDEYGPNKFVLKVTQEFDVSLRRAKLVKRTFAGKGEFHTSVTQHINRLF